MNETQNLTHLGVEEPRWTLMSGSPLCLSIDPFPYILTCTCGMARMIGLGLLPSLIQALIVARVVVKDLSAVHVQSFDHCSWCLVVVPS